MSPALLTAAQKREAWDAHYAKLIQCGIDHPLPIPIPVPPPFPRPKRKD
jgi:hypothetical protein